ncbi:SDR family oxidoreductase [Janthinobacterium sp. SUN026]|uniref:SDR family oxidoreductase n=1 Tax=Janthinobacterium sp. SUN026 TaxID=3002438 RepID=UPI0025B0D683|nr:SDR family oxidoreductase [Janthinobacterium sp. SUN026]MDN2671939.1 SDR family oxidoreductase [Janthinobacterium sp. SUN026]
MAAGVFDRAAGAAQGAPAGAPTGGPAAGAYAAACERLAQAPRRWLVTGVAGFIGSHLLETLLNLGQEVRGLDNFMTGYRHNLEQVRASVGEQAWQRFTFIEGDIRDPQACARACGAGAGMAGIAGMAGMAGMAGAGGVAGAGADIASIGAPHAGHAGRHAGHAAGASDGGEPPDGRADPDGPGAGAGVAVDYVLHEAALGSVSRSLEDPLLCHAVNVSGFLNMLAAAREAGVRRFVYAASSATYGDHPDLPKVEQHIGAPLSPYALSKYVNELYAQVYARCYAMQTVGLRYFNVFGPRQDPLGAYAAVIPRWIAAMLDNEAVHIHGDGATSRDFCFVHNAVQANILAATGTDPAAVNQVYNVAVNARTSLTQLHATMQQMLLAARPQHVPQAPQYGEFRAGDVRHSQADIAKAARLLGYAPTHDLAQGLRHTIAWYVAQADGA